MQLKEITTLNLKQYFAQEKITMKTFSQNTKFEFYTVSVNHNDFRYKFLNDDDDISSVRKILKLTYSYAPKLRHNLSFGSND